MRQNVTNDPAFKKKLEEMTPQMPPLSGEVEFPGLDDIAQQTAAEVNATPPPLSGEGITFPGLDQIGQQTAMEVNPPQPLSGEATIGEFNQPFDKLGGEAFNPNITQPVANLGTPAVTPMVGGDGQITSANELSSFMAGLNQQAGLPATQMPAPQMATPETVAGLSITGTPLTQGAITSPQLPQAPQPQVPNITTPAPAAGQLSGMITRDDTGQTFGLNEGGNLRELNQPEAAALQGDLDRRRAAREAQVMQTFGQMTPEQLAEQRQIGAQAQFDRLSPAERANVEAGRPPNVSEAQVGQAQQEAVARQADYEQRQVNNRIDSQMRQWGRDNPRATEEATAMQRQQLIEQEGLIEKQGAAQGGGLTALEQAEINKINAEASKTLSEVNQDGSSTAWDTGRKQAMKTQAKELAEWEINDLPKIASNIDTLNSVIGALESGAVSTGSAGEQLPGMADWARPFLNPGGELAKQQAIGVVLQSLKETFPGAISDSERKSLVSTAYNPQMGPAENAELLRNYVGRIERARESKLAMTRHFREFGNLEGYTGSTPREALMGGISQGATTSGGVTKTTSGLEIKEVK